MNTIIGCKTYDTDSATSLAAETTVNSHQELFQTPEGEFFLWIHRIGLQSEKLGWENLWPNSRPAGGSESRLRGFQEIIPLTRAEALAWCIETQIPAALRKHVFHCL